MKITVTEQRECCELKDLKPVEGCSLIGRVASVMFCVHCGHRHHYESEMDPAGSRDWRHVKQSEAAAEDR